MKKTTVQIWVSVFVIGLWGMGVIVATLGNDVMLKILTPITTLIFGWLFAAKMTES